MTPAEASRIGREALGMVLMLGGPALIVTLLVGTTVSVFQAVTQVHETTLTFLPKLLAIGILLAISAGWLVEEATSYAQGSFGRIATVDQ
jgi:flagellar biosynthetic protein FliQ